MTFKSSVARWPPASHLLQDDVTCKTTDLVEDEQPDPAVESVLGREVLDSHGLTRTASKRPGLESGYSQRVSSEEERKKTGELGTEARQWWKTTTAIEEIDLS